MNGTYQQFETVAPDGKVVARILDSSWDEFDTHIEAINFAKRWHKAVSSSWVAIYDKLGLFCVIHPEETV